MLTLSDTKLKSENIFDDELDEQNGQALQRSDSFKNSPLKLAITGTGESPDKF